MLAYMILWNEPNMIAVDLDKCKNTNMKHGSSGDC